MTDRKKADARRRFRVGFDSLEGRSLLSGFAWPELGRPVAAAVRAEHAPRASVDRWSWLAGTTWCVPTANVLAISYNPSTGALTPVHDQTVYHISGYRNGYFWGETVAQIDQGAPTSSSVLGSVTPEGKVLLSFNNGAQITQGVGTMICKRGQWTMENQMFTGSTTSQLGHWAYMVQTRPGMKTWASLPFVNVSVPTFLSHYSLAAPRPSA